MNFELTGIKSTEAKKEKPAISQEGIFKFEILTDPQQRHLLAERTMDLVQEVKKGGIQNVVFLDKSARPISTLFIDLWRRLDPQKEIPKTNFVNIGKETSSKMGEVLGEEYTERRYRDSENEYVERVEKLKPSKAKEAIGEQELEHLRKEYRYLSDAPAGANVLLVEEYTNTGESLAWAKKIMQIAFPGLIFKTFSLSEQQASSGSYGRKELGLFEKFRSPFDKTDTYYDSPWRKQKHEKQYGMTGVIDSKDGKLTAEPTRNFTPEDRKKAVEEYQKKYEEIGGPSFEAKMARCIKEMGEFLDLAGVEIDGSDAAETAKKAVKSFLDVEVKPALENLTTAYQEFAQAIIGENQPEARKKFENILGLQKIVTEKLKDFSSFRQHEVTKEISQINKNETKDFRHYVYKIVTHLCYESSGLVKSLYYFEQNMEDFLSLREPHEPGVTKLRKELHQVAEEYWQKSQRDKS